MGRLSAAPQPRGPRPFDPWLGAQIAPAWSAALDLLDRWDDDLRPWVPVAELVMPMVRAGGIKHDTARRLLARAREGGAVEIGGQRRGAIDNRRVRLTETYEASVWARKPERGLSLVVGPNDAPRPVQPRRGGSATRGRRRPIG